jgi:hypothetical protein
MNLRHAAALALVGWYLMVPPFKPHKLQPSFTIPSLEARILNTDAPLSRWEIYVASDSADECEASKAATLKLLDQQKVTGKDGAVTDRGARAILLEMQLRHSQCVATDDPRLKGK